jgi:hypothetical protein
MVFDPFATLTLPLPVPRSISPPFIFVPYNVTEPRILMHVSVISPPTLLEYVDSISQRIGRKVHSVIFADRPPKATYLTWRSTLQTNCFAFEVPPHPSESVFACVRLMACKSLDKTPLNSELDGIFLVELPSEFATNEQVLAACESRFAPLWKPTDGPINPELTEFRENLVANPRVEFGADERMKITIVTIPLETSNGFTRERHFKFVSSRPIQAILNTELIKDSEKFNWAALRRVVEDSTECIPETRHSVPIETCLDMFASDEVLDSDNEWFCPHCRQFVCANKKMDLWMLPNVLVIHLKRFMRTASSPMKLETKVEYPHMIDLSERVVGPNGELCQYRLYGAMYHYGGLSGGHYVARTFHRQTKKWYLFDDANVKPVPSGSHTTDAYVLFYARAPAKKTKKKEAKMPMIVDEEMMKRMFVPRVVLSYVELSEGPLKPAERKRAPRSKNPMTAGVGQQRFPPSFIKL